MLRSAVTIIFNQQEIMPLTYATARELIAAIMPQQHRQLQHHGVHLLVLLLKKRKVGHAKKMQTQMKDWRRFVMALKWQPYT